MKIIRDHCPANHIKVANIEYDYRKQHSRFSFPSIRCATERSRRVIGKHFDKKRYGIDSANEFKRTAAEYLVPKIIDTPKKILINYPSYKNFEKFGKDNPNSRYLCEVLVSKQLVKTIAIRRKAYVQICFYYFHKLGIFQRLS